MADPFSDAAIVPGGRADYPAVAEVWEASVRATHHFLAETDIRFFRPLIADEFLPAVDLYCMKDGTGELLGFLGLAGRKVEMLFLRPDVMGRGLGARLLRFAVDERGADEVDVNEQNPAAVGFYERMGFRVAGRSEADGMGKPFPLLHMRVG
ncbi:GNAT family N-acetyltransferase [Pseudodesulfovibrio sp.]|uniref:GNAT family N-acetyltransferase n=1 Tax=Pseudodesulfovibrio sp. TaxID=2035812 RepID=UPI002614D33A|nr:GNAT family N-acetyltransferase [Pseudodesulfovibrio sp.]MDD3311638.1 GNAT family N-acetyltransferase [Pseudodesulfovibrio sp.]